MFMLKKSITMKSLPLLLIAISAFFLSSCATIFLGPKQTVKVQSNPPGASVYLNDNNMYMETPCKVRVSRRVRPGEHNERNENIYTLKKEGYEDAVYHDYSTFHWLAAVDFFYYVVPGVVDVAAGAHRKFDNRVFINMQKEELPLEDKYIYVERPHAGPYQFKAFADVDQNIPENSSHPLRFALIIGNEDYASFQQHLSSEVNVAYARNDASAMKAYANSCLGIPEENTIFLLDATFGAMQQAIHKMSLIIKNTGGEAEVFVYYAGHGLPDELNREPYLIPVDISGKNVSMGIKLQDLYAQLSTYPAKKVTFFIDACFSGGARNQGLLATRGVKITPRTDLLQGNIVSFTASSANQSSLPLEKQQHGLFTYYLLKKLQETKGDVSYQELADYLKKQVALQSVLVNDKEQEPKVIVSPAVYDAWPQWNIYK